MKFQNIDCEGNILVQRLESLPSWTPADAGRVIYIKSEKILYYGTSEGWQKTFGNGLKPVLVIDDYQAEDQDLLIIDTRNKPILITLPPNPKVGSQISIIDATGTFESNFCTLLGNGKKIQRVDKNLILDISDFSGSIFFDPLTDSWKVEIGGVVQLIGNAVLFAHKTVLIAEDIDGEGGQKQFVFPWEYNPAFDNIAAYIAGIKQYHFEKTNTNSITFYESVPAGAEVEIISMPIEGALDLTNMVARDELIERFLQKKDLLSAIKEIDGAGSEIDADTLDGKQSDVFLEVANLYTELSNTNWDSLAINAATVNGFSASDLPEPGKLLALDANAKFNRDAMPWKEGALQFQHGFDILPGATVLEIPNLNNITGYMIKIVDFTPTFDNVNLHLKIWNESKGEWQVISSWTCQYSDHLSPHLREFNTNSDILLAKNVGSISKGVNLTINLDGFYREDPFRMVTIKSEADGLSAGDNYAAMYNSIGAIEKNKDVYSAIRLYFSEGQIAGTGRVNIYKFKETLI